MNDGGYLAHCVWSLAVNNVAAPEGGNRAQPLRRGQSHPLIFTVSNI